MIGVCFLAFASCSLAAVTKPPPTSEATATQATAITINPKLRKALLEALSNYDGEDSTEVVDDATSSGVTEGFDDSTELPPFVKIHTFAIDGDKSDENEVIKTIIISRPRTTLTPPLTQPRSPSNDISERNDNIELNFAKIPDPVNEESDETENLQSVRSTEPRNAVKKITSEKKEEKPKKKASEKTVNKFIITAQGYTTTTTLPPSTTTTTTPLPIINAEGQNVDKVFKDDVKILQAPLLAAFTVQQNGQGGPEKVISLFKNPAQNDVNEKTIVNMEFKASQSIPESFPTVTPSSFFQLPNTNNANQELVTSFELKQRQLEEQIRFLQARQREQDEIIRQHQQLQSQQLQSQQLQSQQLQTQRQQQQKFEEEQRQRQQFEEERRRQRFDQEQKFLQRQQQAQAVQQPQNLALIAPPSSSANVQFIPSIPLSHTVGISVQQQLPFKGPVEFNPDRVELQKSFQQNQQQFNQRQFQNQVFQQQQQQVQQVQQQQIQRNNGFIQQPQFIQKHEVRELPLASPLPNNLELPVRSNQNFVQFTQLPSNLELPQKPFQTFNSAPLSVLPSLTDIIPQTQGRTRVFRQEGSQTGNFGINDGSNFQIQQQQIDPINASLDNQLQNFFQHSGINTRSADDFRIISKILSLNHGVPNNLFLGNSGRF